MQCGSRFEKCINWSAPSVGSQLAMEILRRKCFFLCSDFGSASSDLILISCNTRTNNKSNMEMEVEMDPQQQQQPNRLMSLLVENEGGMHFTIEFHKKLTQIWQTGHAGTSLIFKSQKICEYKCISLCYYR